MKTLYLLRHAKAEPGSKVISDRERSISARGHTACVATGEYMKAKKYEPDLALISPSARTKETFALTAEAAGMDIVHRVENTLYLATQEEILAMIQTEADDVASLMIVGHNPGMHHVALLLSESRPGPLRSALELKYPTCALSVLRFTCDHWRFVSHNQGKLVDFIMPSELEN